MLEKQNSPVASVFTLPIFWIAGFLICHGRAKFFLLSLLGTVHPCYLITWEEEKM